MSITKAEGYKETGVDALTTYLALYGSSFTIKCRGQNENDEDRKTGIPSVLKITEMLYLSFRKPLSM